jgi:uncharacterized membrane protein
MYDFFHAGGWGMWPTLIFGFLLVASSVLSLLRPERRYLPLVVSLGATTLGSGLLGFSMGLVNTFRFLPQVPQAEQVVIAGLGFEESLHNVILALILIVLSSVLVSASAFRATLTMSPVAAKS